MKEVVQYVAFDGTVFDVKAECLEYEANGYVDEIEKLHIRMQQLKSGEMAQVHKQYLNAKRKYQAVCNSRVSAEQRVNATTRYFNVKDIYHKTVSNYTRLRNRYNFLKNKAREELNA